MEVSYDDCELHPDDVETQKMVDRINIFMQYYKKAYNEPHHTNMFININDEGDTNRCMEVLYEHMSLYNNNPDNIDIFDPIGMDLSIYEDLYILIIDKNQELASETLWSLIIYLSDRKSITDWEINKVV
ncbi:MAG: hypothetical protein R3250_15630 [Melioribacteraceae bacterium]|nr:hypothetical protein [Melioribacteraceae bacterium]